MPTSVTRRLCANCQSQQPLQSAAVRLYFKRSQWEYHYQLCQNCLRQLKMFLWANAENAQGGMFDPPNALSGVTRVRA